MKTLVRGLVVLAVLASASVLVADSVIFSEGFEGAAPGTAVGGYNGWVADTSDASFVISGTTIDAGQSASGGSWGKFSKGFSYTAGAGETWTLTATMLASDTSGSYAHLVLRNSAAVYGSSGYADSYNIPIGYSDTIASLVSSDGNSFLMDLNNSLNVQATVPVDVKLVLSESSQQFYYKLHSASEWTNGGSATISGPALSTYDTISLIMNAKGANGVDSITLTTDVPEPSACMLVLTGVFGLLAYAWRKRK